MIHVIKIGGRAQADPTLPRLLADIAGNGVHLCIVHGGGDEVTALQRQLGYEPRFVGGRRFTSPQDLEVVRMVLSAAINKRLVRQLAAAGLRPVGISGEDGALLPAALFEHGALGAVGTPRKANRQVVDALFDAGFVPVISPVGYDVTTGDGLNINGDDAAAAIAVSLDAEELFLLADVPGVLASDGSALAAVTVDGIEKLLADRVAHSGMAAKLDAARRALLEGVRVVRIGDTTALRDRSRGTVITHSPTPV